MVFQEFTASVIRGGSILLVVGAIGLNGCATVGPKSITAGRATYTEVIDRTENEQILNVLVRMRYDETVGMISVASITANLRFRAQAGAQFGVGDDANFTGNLVPLSAGVAYEENPTISYIPLNGEDFTRRMISPISTNEWVLMEGLIDHPGLMLELVVHRINGLRNPVYGEQTSSLAFARFIELYEQLRRVGVLDIVQTPEAVKEGIYLWDIHDYKNTHDESVREFLELLGIDVVPDGSQILLPLREAVGRSKSEIHVQPRSAYQVLRVFGHGIEVPSPHLDAGIIEPLNATVQERRPHVTIRSSEERPDDAMVQIRFRDWWFYIDATDTQSKRAFSFLRTFIGMRLADTAAGQQGPVLTIPAN